MGCSSSKATTTATEKAERHREANMKAMSKNLSRGKTATGQDPDGKLLQFAGNGSLVVPRSESNPTTIGFGLAAAAGGGGGA